MFLINLIILVALFFMGAAFLQDLFGRKTLSRLSPGHDSLKETQALSRKEAQIRGLDGKGREDFQDSMTLGVCFARFALEVAYGDGHLSQQELQGILAFFRGAGRGYQEHIREVLEQDLAHPESIDWEYNLQEARRVLAKPAWREFTPILFDGLLSISLADGILSQTELRIIYRIMQDLGWSRERCEAMFHSRGGSGFGGSEGTGGTGRRDTSPSDGARRMAEAFQVLGLESGTPREEVRKRYRQLVREHHPDRYATMGEEMQKTATRRFQAIQEAWEYLDRNMG